MSTYSWIRPLPALLITGALTLSFAGGAVAGSLITGADVKDGSLQAKDLSAKAQQSLGAVKGYEEVTATNQLVQPYQSATQIAQCPEGKVPLSATADWEQGGFSPFQFIAMDNGYLARGQEPDGVAEKMNVHVVCVNG